MIYLTIGDNSIEVIQTKRDLFGREKIIAVSQKTIPDGIITDGLINDTDKFKVQLQELFSSAYPKAIDDTVISLSVSDKQVLTYRFSVHLSQSKNKLTERIIDEAKKHIPYDPTELENFYKVLPDSQSEKTDVLYTAMTQNTILQFARLFEQIGGKLVFLSSTSFAIYELIKSTLVKGEKILYTVAESKTIEYFVMDENGPLLTLDAKVGEKLHEDVLKNILTQLKEKHAITISRVIAAGKYSIEINATQFSQSLQLPILKMGDLTETIYNEMKLNIDTGGQPKFLFATAVGLFFLSKNKSAPNFIKDIDTGGKESDSSIQIQKIPEEQLQQESDIKDEQSNDVESKKEETTELKTVLPIQQKRSGFFAFFSGFRLIIIVIIAILTLFIVFFVFMSGSKGSSGGFLPFLTQPTLTPTITLTPTVTPTPTIDPKLKRSDLNISVENGTQKTGYAKEIAAFLETKGYKNIAKSNADRDDYDKSIIKIKKAKANYLPFVILDIGEKVDTSTTEELTDDNNFDIILILGQK